ncbi:MAG: hypothetical protein IKN34_12730 [Treponema sp.]|nr:hypothetical protein [Treponema sp.]
MYFARSSYSDDTASCGASNQIATALCSIVLNVHFWYAQMFSFASDFERRS